MKLDIVVLDEEEESVQFLWMNLVLIKFLSPVLINDSSSFTSQTPVICIAGRTAFFAICFKEFVIDTR
jgi:hypothetical protein